MGSHNNTNTFVLYFSSWLPIKLIESRQHREGCCTASSASSRIQASPLLRWTFCYKHGWKSLFQWAFVIFFTFFNSSFNEIIAMFCRGVTLNNSLDWIIPSCFKNILGKPQQQCGILPIQQLSTRLCHDSKSGISWYFYHLQMVVFVYGIGCENHVKVEMKQWPLPRWFHILQPHRFQPWNCDGAYPRVNIPKNVENLSRKPRKMIYKFAHLC